MHINNIGYNGAHSSPQRNNTISNNMMQDFNILNSTLSSKSPSKVPNNTRTIGDI